MPRDAVKNADDCDACPIAPVARRDFLRHSALGVLLAVIPSEAFAIPNEAEVIPSEARDLHFAVHEVTGTGERTEKAYPIPATDGVAIDKDESVIIARFDSKAYAFSLACPHQNTAIRWDDGNRRFQCPKHKSRYRTDGTFIEGRATRGLDRFAVRREEGTLLVNLDALYREDEEAARWATAFIQLEK